MGKEVEKIKAFVKGEIQSYTCKVCNDCAEAMTREIVSKLEQLGYHKGKPPLLSEEKIQEICDECNGTARDVFEEIAKAQREN